MEHRFRHAERMVLRYPEMDDLAISAVSTMDIPPQDPLKDMWRGLVEAHVDLIRAALDGNLPEWGLRGHSNVARAVRMFLNRIGYEVAAEVSVSNENRWPRRADLVVCAPDDDRHERPLVVIEVKTTLPRPKAAADAVEQVISYADAIAETTGHRPLPVVVSPSIDDRVPARVEGVPIATPERFLAPHFGPLRQAVTA